MTGSDNERCCIPGFRTLLGTSSIMKFKSILILTYLFAVAGFSWAQGTAFTYQGQLSDVRGPANGTYDVTFTLFATNTPGTPSVAGPATVSAVAVHDGLFTALVDFGPGSFTGGDNWLEIAVRTNGAGSFATLAPRQPLSPAPYAIFAGQAENAVTADAATIAQSAAHVSGTVPLSQLPGGIITNGQSGLSLSGTFTGAFTGAGAGLTGLNGSNLLPGSVGTAQLANGVVAPPVSVTGASQNAAANTSYVVNGPSNTSVFLPSSANPGDVIQITGLGAGGWTAFEANPGVWLQTTAPTAAGWNGVASSADGLHLVAVNTGGIYVSGDAGTNWTQTGAPATNWSCIASSADGTHLFAGVSGGSIYASSDSGSTLTPMGTQTGSWNCIATSSNGTLVVAAINGGGIYVSANSGSTWTNSVAPAAQWYSISSSSDGTRLAAVVYGGGIYSSTNSGMTWSLSPAPVLRWTSIASSADGTRLIAGVDGGAVYASTDSGIHWSPTATPGESWVSVASSVDGNNLVAVALFGDIYTSPDFGVTWTKNTASAGGNWWAVASSSDGRRMVAVMHYTGGIWTFPPTFGSLTGAQGSVSSLQYTGFGHWQPITPTLLNGANLQAGTVSSSQLADGAMARGATVYSGSLTVAGNMSYLAANYGPTIFYMPTNAQIGDVVQITGAGPGQWSVLQANPGQWTQTAAPAPMQWYGMAGSSDATHLVAVAQGNGIYTSQDSGATWAQTMAPTSHWSSVASSADGSHLIAVADFSGNIFTSTNYGANWAPTTAPTANWRSVTSSADGTYQVAVDRAGGIYYSWNGGNSWLQSSMVTPPSGAWHAVASSSSGGFVAAAANGGGIFTSLNYGEVFGQSSAPSTNWWSLACSADGSFLVAGAFPGGIYTSTDQGASWVETPAPIANWWSLACSFDGSHIVAASSGNPLYISTDFGKTWSPSSSPTANWDAVFSSGDGTLLAGAALQGGIYTFEPYAQLSSGGPANSVSLEYLGNGQWSNVRPRGLNVGNWQILTSGGDAGSLVFNYGSSNVLKLNPAGSISVPGLLTTASNVISAGEVTCAAVNITSDRAAKEQFKSVSSREVLEKVVRLPITEWQFKSQGEVRHLGPMAQDFRAAFALGRDERHIATVDIEGVALAAIQGLNQKLEDQLAQKQVELELLKSQNRALAERLSTLEQTLGTALEPVSSSK